MRLTARGTAFNRIRELAEQARALGTEGVDAAIERCTRYLDKRGERELSRQMRTGLARATYSVRGSHDRWRLLTKAYTLGGNLKPGSSGPPTGHPAGHIKWSFFKGVPLSALNTMRGYFKLEIIKRLTGT